MATRKYETPEEREARLVRHREVNRAYRERNPRSYRDYIDSMTPEQLAEYKQKRHEAYKRRKGKDVEAFRKRARENARDYLARNRERVKTLRRANYARDPERHIGYAKDYAERHPEKMRDKQYVRYYGVTLDAYQQMYAAQGGLCAICKRPETMTQQGKLKQLSVDHDHQSGMVRKLLCSACNRALGFFNDDSTRVASALEYLREHEAN